MNRNWLQLYSALILSAKTSTDLGVVQEEGVAFFNNMWGATTTSSPIISKGHSQILPPWFSSNRKGPNL